VCAFITASSAGERESEPGSVPAAATVEPTAETTETRDIDHDEQQLFDEEQQQQQQQRCGDDETAEQHDRVGPRTGGFNFEPVGQQRSKVRAFA